MSKTTFTIRAGVPDDGAVLHRITAAAKGHWGYPAAMMSVPVV
jgi:hypothetical protein